MIKKTQICKSCAAVYTIEYPLFCAKGAICPVCGSVNVIQSQRKHSSQTVHEAKNYLLHKKRVIKTIRSRCIRDMTDIKFRFDRKISLDITAFKSKIQARFPGKVTNVKVINTNDGQQIKIDGTLLNEEFEKFMASYIFWKMPFWEDLTMSDVKDVKKKTIEIQENQDTGDELDSVLGQFGKAIKKKIDEKAKESLDSLNAVIEASKKAQKEIQDESTNFKTVAQKKLADIDTVLEQKINDVRDEFAKSIKSVTKAITALDTKLTDLENRVSVAGESMKKPAQQVTVESKKA